MQWSFTSYLDTASQPLCKIVTTLQGTVSYHPSVQSVQGCHTAVTSRSSTRISYCKNNTLSVSDKEVLKLIPTSQSVTEKLMQQVPSITLATVRDH